MQKKVLFISHDASRTGAPILLLNFLKWLKTNTNIPFLILLRDGGELTSEFKALAPVLFFREQIRGEIIRRGLRRLGFANFFLFWLKRKLVHKNIGLIYSNTIVNGDVLKFLSFLQCPTISHVHELESEICWRGENNIEQIKRYTRYYIAVSDIVKNNLITHHNIPESSIEKIYEFVPLSNIKSQSTREQICDGLGIPKEAFIVCAGGTTGWRKAPDIFIQLARAINKQIPNKVYFLWIGGETTGTIFYELMYDVKKLGLQEYVRFLGAKSNPFDYLSACDVFAMVSREDPFPIICLEAAAFGKPIVCFDNGGGIKEFVEDDCGFIVPYLDVETMAVKVFDLLNSSELRQRLGRRAQEKVRERHNIEALAPKILAIIEKYLL